MLHAVVLNGVRMTFRVLMSDVLSPSRILEICTPGSMRRVWKQSDGLVIEAQPIERSVTDWPYLRQPTVIFYPTGLWSN